MFASPNSPASFDSRSDIFSEKDFELWSVGQEYGGMEFFDFGAFDSDLSHSCSTPSLESSIEILSKGLDSDEPEMLSDRREEYIDPWLLEHLSVANNLIALSNSDTGAQLSSCGPERAKGLEKERRRVKLPFEPPRDDRPETDRKSSLRTSRKKNKGQSRVEKSAWPRSRRTQAFKIYKENDSLWLDKAQTSIDEELCKLTHEIAKLRELDMEYPAKLSTSLGDIILRNTARYERLASLQGFLIACGAKVMATTKALV